MSTDIQEILFDSINGILKDHCSKELIDSSEAGNWPNELWDILEESQITLLGTKSVTEEFGGNHKIAFDILKLIGKHSAPIPIAETIIVNWINANYSDLELTGKLTLKVDNNEKLIVTKQNNRFIVSGKLSKVKWGRVADHILTFINLENETYLATLPLDKAHIVKNQNLAGEYLDDILFNYVELTSLQFTTINSLKVEKEVKELGALAYVAMMTGALEEILELSVLYSKEREQFGRPLHRFQTIQQMLANIMGYTVAGKTITNAAINALNREDFSLKVAVAKLILNKLSGEVNELSHQIHGAIGVTHEHRLHQVTRRLWSWREEYGTELYWRGVIKQNISENYTSSLWETITK